ncbi:MAG: hypothetical protein C4567_02100 [Deltaproteobacteria bacterium]|nr:MAG: hypothetical protein C4567_02100 [Deltaproteobacteria bacterium]
MKRGLVQIFSGVLFLLLLSPGYASAQGWFLWGTEGSYIHQLAHLLFCGAMIFFIYEMRQEKLLRFRGLRSLMWGCGILALWNLDAVVGHTLEWGRANRVFIGQGFFQRLVMEDWESWFYYLTKIDHFALLIPAFYLFYRGLKTLALESKSESR